MGNLAGEEGLVLFLALITTLISNLYPECDEAVAVYTYTQRSHFFSKDVQG